MVKIPIIAIIKASKSLGYIKTLERQSRQKKSLRQGEDKEERTDKKLLVNNISVQHTSSLQSRFQRKYNVVRI